MPLEVEDELEVTVGYIQTFNPVFRYGHWKLQTIPDRLIIAQISLERGLLMDGYQVIVKLGQSNGFLTNFASHGLQSALLLFMSFHQLNVRPGKGAPLM